MKFTRTEPCPECPFLAKFEKGYELDRLLEFANEGMFPCHKTTEVTDDGEYVANEKSVACAGMLIFNEKRNKPNQMMRIAGRLRMYDRTKLNMEAEVRECEC